MRQVKSRNKFGDSLKIFWKYNGTIYTKSVGFTSSKLLPGQLLK